MIQFNPKKDVVKGENSFAVSLNLVGNAIEYKTASEQFLEILEDIDLTENKIDSEALQAEAEDLALGHGIATSETSFWASEEVTCF